MIIKQVSASLLLVLLGTSSEVGATFFDSDEAERVLYCANTPEQMAAVREFVLQKPNKSWSQDLWKSTRVLFRIEVNYVGNSPTLSIMKISKGDVRVVAHDHNIDGRANCSAEDIIERHCSQEMLELLYEYVERWLVANTSCEPPG